MFAPSVTFSNVCRPLKRALPGLLGVLCGVSGGWAEEMESGALGGELPQPVGAEQFRELMENSPFTRALNLAETLVLTGVARIDNELVATLLNKETKESYVITETPNSQGWKLVEVAKVPHAEGLEIMEAKFSIRGEEVVTVRFAEDRARPTGASGSFDTRQPPSKEEVERFLAVYREKWEALTKDQQEEAKRMVEEAQRKNPRMSLRETGEIVMRIVNHVGAASSGRSDRDRDSSRR